MNETEKDIFITEKDIFITEWRTRSWHLTDVDADAQHVRFRG